MCVVLAVSLFAGCAHFESIEYSQEISEENPETIEAFDQFINDIFETEVTKIRSICILPSLIPKNMVSQITLSL